MLGNCALDPDLWGYGLALVKFCSVTTPSQWGGKLFTLPAFLYVIFWFNIGLFKPLLNEALAVLDGVVEVESSALEFTGLVSFDTHEEEVEDDNEAGRTIELWLCNGSTSSSSFCIANWWTNNGFLGDNGPEIESEEKEFKRASISSLDLFGNTMESSTGERFLERQSNNNCSSSILHGVNNPFLLTVGSIEELEMFE